MSDETNHRAKPNEAMPDTTPPRDSDHVLEPKTPGGSDKAGPTPYDKKDDPSQQPS